MKVNNEYIIDSKYYSIIVNTYAYVVYYYY